MSGRNENPLPTSGRHGRNGTMFGSASSEPQHAQVQHVPVAGEVDNQNPQQTNESIGQHYSLASQHTPMNANGFQVPLNANDVGSIPTNHMYMNVNPNGAAAQAFAAAALAAQQIIQAQMGMNAPAQQTQKVAPQHFQQQNPIAVQAQAQAAAILAASSLGPNNMFNQAQNTSVPAMAAAQAFALMLQQQQAQSTHKQGQLAPSTMLHAPVSSNMQQLQLLQSSRGAQQATQEMIDIVQQKNDQLKSQSPQPSCQQQTAQQSKVPPRKRIIQTAKQEQHSASAEKDSQLPKMSQLSKLPPAHHVKYSSASSVVQVPALRKAQQLKPMKQVSSSPFQMPVSTPPISSIVPVHHNSIASSQHVHNNLFKAAMNPIVLSQMQSWKLNQLESHVQLLNETNQAVPQPVQILLAEARRLEEKRAAKRIANRKSACTSRARKKALVAEMTKTNARLRRQAIILSLLPDLVVAIKDDGTITFCSAQVERVLRHKLEDLVGANIGEVLTPSSRTALSALTEKLVAAQKVALEDGNNKEGDESGRSSNSGNTRNSQAAIVSEQSDNFPLSVVKVKSHKPSSTNDASDFSGNGNNTITDTPLSHMAQSPITNQSNSDGSTNPHGNDGSTGIGSNNSGKRKGSVNSDVDSSSDTKNLSEANDALNRNVRFHNEQLKIKKENKKKCIAHKDDVTGDYVTANNADARLSSLMKQGGELEQSGTEAVKKVTSTTNMENLEVSSSSSSTDSLLAGVEDRQKKRKRTDNNASDDSGYRESGESDPSREDSAFSTSDASNAGGRRRPLAPTCNICLIRDNLTTIWCEVTSSIRTRSVDEDDVLTVTTASASIQKRTKSSSSNSSEEQQSANDSSQNAQIKELLLCLRPIRDGVEKVSEDLRFVPSHKRRYLVPLRGNKVDTNESGSSVDATSIPSIVKPGTITTKLQDDNVNERRPMKKRPLDDDSQLKCMGEVASKKQAIERQDNDAEKSVVESLILMSSN